MLKTCGRWLAGCLLGLATLAGAWAAEPAPTKTMTEPKTNQTELATFGGGCFWCLDAVFAGLKGVKSVTSGFAGGHTVNPTYKEVCTGETGHAEVIQVEYDPHQITYERILNVFWEAHDPTTLNRQGPDTGTQYRSIILYRNEAEKRVAEKTKHAAQAELSAPIVTEIVPLAKFYPAEGYHQGFYAKNPNQPYCAYVIRPKLEKLKKKLGKQ